jgi:hypothetical protein
MREFLHSTVGPLLLAATVTVAVALTRTSVDRPVPLTGQLAGQSIPHFPR